MSKENYKNEETVLFINHLIFERCQQTLAHMQALLYLYSDETSEESEEEDERENLTISMLQRYVNGLENELSYGAAILEQSA